MNRLYKIVDGIHRWVAKSQFALSIVLKVRNQCNRIVQCHLGPSSKADANGEASLIRNLGSSLKVVFDVGANVGEWTSLVRSHNKTAEIHVFECNRELQGPLSDRFKYFPNVFIHAFAMGDADENRTFFHSKVSTELGSLVPSGNLPEVHSEQVVVRTVDSCCAELNIQEITLLKIDTEGNDFHILRGAKDMIAGRHIKVIQFEYGEFWSRAGVTLDYCLSWLLHYQYRTYLLTADRLKIFEYSKWGEFLGYSNFVALAPSIELGPDGFPVLGN
jgi:FkbM family methyltransferase